MSAHTKGPWRFVQSDQWPFELTIYAGGELLVRAPMPAHTSSDKTADDALNAVYFAKDERERCAAMNREAVANFTLWAASPDLLSIAKRWAALDAGGWHPDRCAADKAQLIFDTLAAIAKAEPQSARKEAGL